MLQRVERIKREIGKMYGVSVGEMESPSRETRIVRARHVAMAEIRKKTSCSFPEIGYYFGKRDHSSVIYAIRSVKKFPDRYYPRG